MGRGTLRGIPFPGAGEVWDTTRNGKMFGNGSLSPPVTRQRLPATLPGTTHPPGESLELYSLKSSRFLPRGLGTTDPELSS